MYYGHRTPWLVGAGLVVAVAVVGALFRVLGWVTALGVPRSVAALAVFGGAILLALAAAGLVARRLR